MPRVSVLIPTWNREEYLGEAIESVLAQTYRDFEIVVVDDGSTDGTAELVKRYDQVRYVWQPHSGIPAARNRALEEARGELIAWLDSDDLYAPTKLEKQVAYLDTHPECQIVFCLPVGFSGIAYRSMTHSQQKLTDVYGAAYKRCLPAACIRETLFAQYGKFLPDYSRGEDTEWIARICIGGVDIGHCLMERLYRARIHDSQVSHRTDIPSKKYLKIYADAIRSAKREMNRAEHRKDPH